MVILQCIFTSNYDDILDKKNNLILLDILKQLLNSNGQLLNEQCVKCLIHSIPLNNSLHTKLVYLSK